MIRHVVLTDTKGRPVGRARIDLDARVADGTDINGEGWQLYRTGRGRVVARWRPQWANIGSRWTADPAEVAEIMAAQGWDLDDADRSVIDALAEI